MKSDKALPRFKIYYAPTGYGLVKDARILHDAIQKLGFPCLILPVEHTHKSAIYRYWLYLLKKYNALGICKKIARKLRIKNNVHSLHLENIVFEKCFLNENHILIPNQEWFDPYSIDLLSFMEAVWCKSHFARDIFNEFNCSTEYIGFCSEVNKNFVGVNKSRDYFFSRTGKSKYRGGKLLIDLWSQHPEWPLLKIVIDKDNVPHQLPNNVECLAGELDTDEFQSLASSSLFHIYMTETEGFSHSIVEAMGYGSVMIVTNAPPMNEILDGQCAILVKANYIGQKMLAPRFGAEQSDAVAAINKVLALNEEEINRFSANAQSYYRELQNNFLHRLSMAIKKLP